MFIQELSVGGCIIKQTCNQALPGARSRGMEQTPQAAKECWLRDKIP